MQLNRPWSLVGDGAEDKAMITITYKISNSLSFCIQQSSIAAVVWRNIEERPEHQPAFGVWPSEVTFASVLAYCGAASQLLLSKQVHGLVTNFGFCGNVILGSSLVYVYVKCEFMIDARRMFHEIPQPNAVTWNVIMRRYLDAIDAREAVFMFSQMFFTTVNK
ncbi:Pentatricopeptide repeat-containing protein [Vigna angularis]|uniref:Pentatricopeptide repeat-containing protein n=1 Tax=Phaseolus angularis TaxID=3914 RepID=A0A8T0K2L8_PHAAN|nr:Pentatricopeptide repeat-containing protein [Vigna angularis]